MTKLLITSLAIIATNIILCLGVTLYISSTTNLIKWSFEIPYIEGATQITTDGDGFFMPYHKLPYTIYGESREGTRKVINVWYSVSDGILNGTNIQESRIVAKQYVFIVG